MFSRLNREFFNSPEVLLILLFFYPQLLFVQDKLHIDA